MIVLVAGVELTGTGISSSELAVAGLDITDWVRAGSSPGDIAGAEPVVVSLDYRTGLVMVLVAGVELVIISLAYRTWFIGRK